MEIGGAQKLLEIQLAEMSASYDLLVVSLGPETPMAAEYVSRGAEVLSNGLARLSDVSGLLRLRREIGHWGPDLVHSHLTYGTLVGSLIAVWLKVPHVVTLHSEWVRPNRFPDRVKDRLERYALSHRTDAVIACGRRVEQSHQWRIGRTPMQMVLNRVRPAQLLRSEDLAAARAAEGIGPEQRVVLAAGRLVEGKGFHLLIDAFARIAAGNPEARLMVAGDGPERAALERKVASLELQGRVGLIGPVASLVPLLQLADVFALPSLHEGLPLVILEALAAGRPILATRVGDISSAMGQQSGMLVEPGLVEPLAAALDRLLGDEALRRRMGAAALEASRPYTDLSAFVVELENVYGGVLQPHHAGR
jgi:glycosyltransferase involved in cell wall biosynthesis